ncbi:MAG: hypothetical protein SFW09_01800 [Hyphomicrobiaceae bacterium]|nr:hypothetical protein [Hyphomicrobiaceae bacterium]
MRAVLAILLGAHLLACPRAAIGEEQRSDLVWMSGEEIQTEFSGKPLAGLYPSERDWREKIHADGTTDYAEGDKRWRGAWWVQDREFCFSYPPPGAGGCFRVTRISANCFELYEFGSAQGRSDEPPNLANLWNGRMWHSDRPTTCEVRPSV